MPQTWGGGGGGNCSRSANNEGEVQWKKKFRNKSKVSTLNGGRRMFLQEKKKVYTHSMLP